ncbi:MAG: neutral zinc metallopeptidase [Longimicrobiales bacterium]
MFDTDGCPDTPADFYQVVRADVEAYWTATLAPLFPYPPVGTFLGYTAPLGSPCGPLVLNNAFYCPANAGVYFDGTFMGAYLAAVGDMAPAFIISHEIGHHVSWLLGWVPPVISTKENELQADCFGGAWARSADDRGLLDEGDLEEAVVALISVGDPDYTWFDPTGHGTPLQRVSAFAMGFDGGPPACTNQAFFDAFPANSP